MEVTATKRRVLLVVIAIVVLTGVACLLYCSLFQKDHSETPAPEITALPEVENSAELVDTILASNLQWQAAHPVSKAHLRVIGAPAAPVGQYYLDLRPDRATEIAITSVLLEKSELIVRTVKEGDVGLMFFNEEVYVKFNPDDLSNLDAARFWKAPDVAGIRACLTELFEIRGVVRETVEDVTYSGIHLELKKSQWEEYRANVAPTLVANYPASFWPFATVFFGPSGELHSIRLTGGEVDVEVLYVDWVDLAGDQLAELNNACRPPQAEQELWNMPLDTAAIKYVTKLAE